MKLKLVIRFNGLVIDEFNLAEGEYELGRSKECAIHVNHPSIHRKHGKITGDKKVWTYQDYTTGKVHPITDEDVVSLSEEFDIATETFTTKEKTGDLSQAVKRFRRQRRRKLTYGSLIALGLVFGAVFTYAFVKWYEKPSDPNVLLSHVRAKIVEFERDKDMQAIEDYKVLGNFDDTDFRGQYGFCTGFLVAPNVVLTALHCLAGGDFLDINTAFKVRAYNGKKFRPKRVLGFDPIRDYLYLEVDGMESYGYLEFAPSYHVGQTVYTIGNAHGQGIAIREGIMASETADVNNPNIKHIRYSAGASPGNSGGPLLDTSGRIVALVFAATGAENYNLGTPAKDLADGYEKFVTNTKKKNINVTLKRILNFNAHKFLRRQLLPYLSDYDQFPEMLQKVNNMELVFEAPMDFSKATEMVLNEVNEKSTKVVLEIEETLAKRGKITLDWFSFLSTKTPAILYSQFDSSQNNFYKHDDRYLMKVSGFIDSPGNKEYQGYLDQLRRESKFDFQAYGMNNEIKTPIKEPKTAWYLPKNKEKTKRALEDLSQGSVYSQFLLSYGEEEKTLDFDKFMEGFLGEEGVISSVYSPFIRPHAYKNFVVNKINKEPVVDSVVDGVGRTWKRYYIKVFEIMQLYVYCMEVPEGSLCIGRVFPVDSKYRLQILEENFRKEILAHFIENPYFWKPEALVSFLKTDKISGLRSLKGFELTENKDSYSLKLDGFNLQFELPKSFESVRVQTGLFLGKDKKEGWTGFGAEWLTGGKNPKLCGAGIEPVGSQAAYVLNFKRDAKKRKKLKDEDEKVEIPEIWTKTVTTSRGDKVQIYGYCAPLRENPIEIGYYFVDFKKAQPRAVPYKTVK